MNMSLRWLLFAACTSSYTTAHKVGGRAPATAAFLDTGHRRSLGKIHTKLHLNHSKDAAYPEVVESANEADEEKETGNKEERAMHSALGAPHEGQGLESEVPATISEDAVEGNNALHSVKGLAAGVVMPASGVFLLCIMIGNGLSISKYTSWVPESAATLAVSVLLGLVIRYILASGHLSLHTFTFVNATVLNLALLPIIIFNSGWALRKGDFMSQLEYILVFAILGTVISTVFIGCTTYYVTGFFHYIQTLTFRESFAFAALISAVDPVATLATYNELNIPTTQPLLNIMVFGESTINDAVAIVLFETFNQGWEELGALTLIYDASKLLFGSILFGLCISFFLVFMMRAARLPGHTAAEILYIWTCAYFIYSSAEATGFSGIISVLFGGMIFGIYGRQHLVLAAQALAGEYLELGAKTADNAVFILCGASTALINSHRGLIFGFYAVVLCLVARFLSVGTCAGICNTMKAAQGEPNTLTWKHQIGMWHGGLRGGIALVLALELNQHWCVHKAMIINATFVVICVLLLCLGSTTELLIDKLKFPPQKDLSETALMVEGRWYKKICNFLDSYFAWALVGPPKPEPKDGEHGKLKAHLSDGTEEPKSLE